MATRNVMSQKTTFALLKYMEAEYVGSGLTDPDFAAKATEVLGINPPLSRSHITTARLTLGFASNAPHGGQSKESLTSLKVKELEDLILAMAVRLDDCVRKIDTLQRDLHLHPVGVVRSAR